jgi:chemotaxis protein CheZ
VSTTTTGLHDLERSLMRSLNVALAANDATRFNELLDQLLRARESSIQAEVLRISTTLQEALSRFRMDSRIAALAEKDMPDARQRLDHVVELTEKAAHQTLEMIERSVPLADETARRAAELAKANPANVAELTAFLKTARDNCDAVRANLTEVMLAQGFQDITGQIIRGVHKLIGEVETVLDDLMSVHGISRDVAAPSVADRLKLEGPAIPGVTPNAVTDQSDIDDLMAGLGL